MAVPLEFSVRYVLITTDYSERYVKMKFQKKTIRETIEYILSTADITVDGGRPWDMEIHESKFFSRVLASGSLGLGESYMESWWDCQQLDEFFYRILSARLDEQFKSTSELVAVIKSKLINLQTPLRSMVVGKRHYDLGNNLFEKMLDERLIYSCGYWKGAKTLDQAQINKLDLVCRKLGLQRGMRVLDLGCGWGGAAKFVAEQYGVEVVGITISEQQKRLAEETCKGLPVDIRLQDYRSLNEKFDRIYSLGMFEHVGYKNYSTYFKTIKRNLTNDGLFLLHTIGGSKSVTETDPWIGRYIFPNSMLPSIKQISENSEGLLVLEDFHNFGVDYDKTLMQWHANFNENWAILKKDYDPEFKRLWNYYLLSCAGSFRARKNHLWQCVFSANGVTTGYESVR